MDGVQHRRQGFRFEAEAQEALDAARDGILRPAPAALPAVPAMTLGEAVERYLKAKTAPLRTTPRHVPHESQYRGFEKSSTC